MNQPMTLQEAVDDLNQTGDLDAIVSRLEAGGYRGKRGECDACVLSSFLSAQCSIQVRVSGSWAYPIPLDVERQVRLPDDLRHLVRQFDAGVLRQLEEVGEACANGGDAATDHLTLG